MEESKLIVSTKSTNSGMKTAKIVSNGLLILIGCILLFSGILDDLAHEFFGSSSSSWLLYILILACSILFPVFSMIVSLSNLNSYCDVYEKSVSGKTGMSFTDTKAPVQTFELSYNEIVNVTESGKNIIIYTQYGKYEVAACKNQTEVVNAIRARMTGNK